MTSRRKMKKKKEKPVVKKKEVECDICNDVQCFAKENGNSFSCLCTYEEKDLPYADFMGGTAPHLYEMSMTDEQAVKWDEFLIKKGFRMTCEKLGSRCVWQREPREMGEHTTYKCYKCGNESGCA